MDSPTNRSVMQEAHELVNGPRQAEYGNPLENWTRTAAIWSAILGIQVTPEQAVRCMIGVKLARQCHKSSRDNLTDIAGYAGVEELIDQIRKAPIMPAEGWIHPGQYGAKAAR